MEIRRIAETHDDSQSRAIASTAEAAIIELLVDTPTAQLIEATQDGLPAAGDRPTTTSQTPAAAALTAAQHLHHLARTLLTRGGDTCLPYAMVAPHVDALIRWFSTLEREHCSTCTTASSPNTAPRDPGWHLR